MATSLDAIFSAGGAAFPAVRLEHAAFLAHAGGRAIDPATITDDNAVDFFLAAACACGDEAGIRILSDQIRDQVRGAVQRIDANPAFIDDVLQALTVRLVIDDPPRIAEFEGRSSLRRWLGTAAMRLALNLKRGKANESHDELASQITDDLSGDGELDLVRGKYRELFEGAMRRAIAGLSHRDRALLRMSIVEHMGLDRVSRIYGCSRATAARWMVAARERALAAITRELRGETDLTETELSSLADALKSRVDVSLARLLEEPGEGRE
jgi:RNA polymerase sigma-70 factor (ECF subfamily)